jgi:hypothetical protein
MVSIVGICQAFSNYDADAIIGATVSEIMTGISLSFIPAMIEGAPDYHGPMAVRSLAIWHNLRKPLQQII